MAAKNSFYKVWCAVRTNDWPVALAHHLIAASMLCLMLLVLESLHGLEWLDAAMLRVAGSSLPTHDDGGAADPRRPSVIAIDTAGYRTLFGQRSPLDRHRLATLIASLDLRPSRVLAIDIDIAPLPDEPVGADGRRELDTVLVSLVKAGKHVVLVLPDPSDIDANLGWIRARCDDGVRFASPAIRERLGAVTRMMVDVPTLAVVAFHASTALPDGKPFVDAVCELARTGVDERLLKELAEEPVEEDARHARHAESAPLRPDAIPHPSVVIGKPILFATAGGIAAAPAQPLHDVVLLGGTYESGDLFRTAAGSLPGVEVHAATLTSLRMGSSDVGPWSAGFADVVIGTILGFGFGAAWGWFGHFEAHVLHADRITDRSLRFVLRLYGLRVVQLFFWLVTLGIAWWAFLAAQSLLRTGMWLNPGPIVLGMFVHAMSLRHQHSEAGGEHGEHGVHTKTVYWPTRLLREHPDSVYLQIPAIVLLFLWAWSLH